MKNLMLLLSLALGSSSLYAQPVEIDSNKMLLPAPFNVYVKGNVVINHPADGFTQKLLPTNNKYLDNPGCYVTCYSKQSANAAYALNDTMYVVGQVRVPGKYQGTICNPTGYEGKDISAAPEFKQLCQNAIPSCDANCWAGGDTGGWFGLQPS